MRKLLTMIVTFALLCSCQGELDLKPTKSELVVEGWIEDGKFPVVILTKSIPPNTTQQNIDELYNYIVRWAKVTVTDGVDSVVLSGKTDNGYFPPYIYTTGRLRGVAGKTYRLIVDYGEYQAEATTTIPASTDSCTFEVAKGTDTDTLYQISARYIRRDNTTRYFQLFSRTGTKSKQFLASYLGTFASDVLNHESAIPVYRGHYAGLSDYTPFYTIDDTVSVKMAQLDYESYRVWNSINQDRVTSNNVFLTTSSFIESNIIGGYGYWCGYNSITAKFIIRDVVN